MSETDSRDGRTGHTTPEGLCGPYIGDWVLLEATGSARVEARQHTAGGLELRHSSAYAPSETFRLSGEATDALRRLLARTSTGASQRSCAG